MLRNAMDVLRDNAASNETHVASVQNDLKVRANAEMVVDATHAVAVVVSVAQSVRVNVVPSARLSAVTRLAQIRATNLVLTAEVKVVAHVPTVATRATKYALTLKATKLLQII